MKYRKKTALFLSLVMMLWALSGCQAGEPASEPSQSADTSITVVDMFDRTVTLDQPATRVVALSAADCEILYAIGAGDTLVGRGEYCDYPAQVMDVPSVESGSETNIEQIIALKPQVLLMSSMAQPKEHVDALEKAGIKCVVSESKNIEDVYTAIQLIGKLMGKEDNAEKLVADMQATFTEIKSQDYTDHEKTVYFEVSPLQYGLWAAGSGTYMNEIAEMMGLTNIFADVEGWAAVSEEQVLERDPDYIVTIGMYFGEGPTPTEEILSRDAWQNVTAVKNEAVLNLSNNELSRPAPRLADGARMMFDFVYGNER